MDIVRKEIAEAALLAAATYCTGFELLRETPTDVESKKIVDIDQEITGSVQRTSGAESNTPAGKKIPARTSTTQYLLEVLSLGGATNAHHGAEPITQQATGSHMNDLENAAAPAGNIKSPKPVSAKPSPSNSDSEQMPQLHGEATATRTANSPPFFSSFKEEVEERRRWKHIQEAMREQRFDQSPFVPKTFWAYIAHILAMGAWSSFREEDEKPEKKGTLEDQKLENRMRMFFLRYGVAPPPAICRTNINKNKLGNTALEEELKVKGVNPNFTQNLNLPSIFCRPSTWDNNQNNAQFSPSYDNNCGVKNTTMTAAADWPSPEKLKKANRFAKLIRGTVLPTPLPTSGAQELDEMVDNDPMTPPAELELHELNETIRGFIKNEL